MAPFHVLLLCLLPPAAWTVYSWYCLLLNHLRAHEIGVPVIIPISHENPPWMIVDKKFVDSITAPHKESFIAWSEGIRNCPGKKSSLAEYVTAMAGLFRDWRVDPVPEGTEDLDTARRGVMHMVEEDTGQVLLWQMSHPERAALVWKRR